MVRPTQPSLERAEDLAWLVARARRQNRARVGLMLCRAGESVLDWQVMGFIAREGPKSQRELADHVGLHQTGLSRRLDHLARRAMLHRVPDPADARRRLVTLTGRGKAWVRRWRPRVTDELYANVSNLGVRQQKSLIGLLTLLTQR
jgi:DNA-binding MarR family transcriptional regulator